MGSTESTSRSWRIADKVRKFPRSNPTDRVSNDDLMSLASERGATPMQVGAVLMLDAREGLDHGLVVDAIASRVTVVPRLRQRLVKVPWGCGRPVWVDDRDFNIANHVSSVRHPAARAPSWG